MSNMIEDEPSVKATMNAGHFTNVFQALSEIRDEGKVKFTPKGVYSKVTSPSESLMGICKVTGQSINGISLEGDVDHIMMGAKYDSIYTALNSFKSSSDIQVKFPEEIAGSYAVKFKSPDEGMEFSETVLDEGTVPNMATIDPLSHKRRIAVDGTKLKKAINNADRYVSDSDNSVEFGTDGNVFYIESSDKVSGRMRKEFYPSGPTEDNDLGNVESSIGYPLVKSIKKVVGQADAVTIHIEDDQPIRFDVDLDDTGDAQIIYLIAPRVESQ